MHPTDTHPPLRTRLEALQISGDELKLEANDFKPGRPAAALLGDLVKIEEGLTEAEREFWQARIRLLQSAGVPAA